MYHPGTITLTWENSEQIFKGCPNHMRDQWYYGWWCLVSSSWTFLVETYPIKEIKLSFKPSEVSAKPKFLPNLFALKKHEIWDLKIKVQVPVSNVISMKIHAISQGSTGSTGQQLHWVSLDIFAGSPRRRVRLSTDRRPGVFFEARCSIPIGSIYGPFTDI